MADLLEVRNLVTRFHTQNGVVMAVNGVSFSLNKGETLGLVGESGCGKSVTMRSIMRLIPDPPGKIEAGQVLFEGVDLLTLDESAMRKVRGARIGMIFQDPMTSLNPVLTIGLQIMEALEEHLGMDHAKAHRRAIELLDLVGIPNASQRLDNYPHQFSGGMRQRAMIAMALACNPELLIADEPTTALDVTIQSQIIELVKSLQKELGMAVIWITHDLGVVARLTKRVAVMYAGYIIEEARVRDLYHDPRHPYTLGLLRSLPRLDEAPGTKLLSIPGHPPDQVDLPPGCPFAPRCRFVVPHCLQENPVLQSVAERHRVACWETERVNQEASHVPL